MVFQGFWKGWIWHFGVALQAASGFLRRFSSIGARRRNMVDKDIPHEASECSAVSRRAMSSLRFRMSGFGCQANIGRVLNNWGVLDRIRSYAKVRE